MITCLKTCSKSKASYRGKSRSVIFLSVLKTAPIKWQRRSAAQQAQRTGTCRTHTLLSWQAILTLVCKYLTKGSFVVAAVLQPWTCEPMKGSESQTACCFYLMDLKIALKKKKKPACCENSSPRWLINLIFHSVFSLWLALRISTLINTSSWAAIRKKKGGGGITDIGLTGWERWRRKQNLPRLYEMALEDRTTAVCACSALVCKNKVRLNDDDEGT